MWTAVRVCRFDRPALNLDPCETQPPMANPIETETARLHLRQWRYTDYEPFVALNAELQAMAFFPYPLSVSASDALAHRDAGTSV